MPLRGASRRAHAATIVTSAPGKHASEKRGAGVRRMGVILLAGAIASMPSAADATSDQFQTTLEIAGRISPACAVAFDDERVSLGPIDQAGAAVTSLTVECNQPLAYRLQSENGGLRHETSDAAPLVPYQARFALVGGASGEAISSADMTGDGAQGDLDGEIPFSSAARLTVRWDEPTELLHSGKYRDVITLTVVAPDGCPPPSPSPRRPHPRRHGEGA
jgi:hypothetical protein